TVLGEAVAVGEPKKINHLSRKRATASPMDEELTIREAGERRMVAEITGMMLTPSMLIDGFGHDAAFVDLRQRDNELLVLNTDRSGLNAAYGLGLAGPECVGDFGVSHAISDIVVS